MRVGVVYWVGLGWRQWMGVMLLLLWGRWQWVVGQGMRLRVGVRVATLHGVLLVSRGFMVGVIVLVVEAAVPFHGAPSSIRVPPARRGVMTLAGYAMVGWREDRGGGALALRRLGRKVPRGRSGGAALGPPRCCGHGLTDHRGVGDMGPGGCGGLRQLSAAATWRTGPRRRGDGTSTDRTTALHEK